MSYQAKKWTSEELDTLLELIKKGKDYKYISTKLSPRSEFAVKCKFESYVFDKISNKKSTTKELAKELKLSEEEINDAYQSQFKRNMTQSQSSQSQSNSYSNTQTQSQSQSTNIFQLGSVNSYSILNRILTPYIEYHENLKKLDEIKDMIDKKTYKKIKEILDSIDFDTEKFLSQLKKTSETLKIQPEPVKSNSTTDESDVDSKQSTKKSDNESDEEEIIIPMKPLRKRLI
jgi:hypothetical protein